jgi:ferritin-like metal-binding protein YciE
MQAASLSQLYVDELRILYSAEIQFARALPKMTKAASDGQLRQALEEHLRLTAGQVSRLEKIFDQLNKEPAGRKALGVEGLLKEGLEAMREDEEAVRDAALIAVAQRVAHCGIAGYGTVHSFAKLLGHADHAAWLELTLQEEKQVDEELGALSHAVNVRPLQKVEGDMSGKRSAA